MKDTKIKTIALAIHGKSELSSQHVSIWTRSTAMSKNLVELSTFTKQNTEKQFYTWIVRPGVNVQELVKWATIALNGIIGNFVKIPMWTQREVLEI